MARTHWPKSIYATTPLSGLAVPSSRIDPRWAKYLQGGTGQVFYLSRDGESGEWLIEMFVDGPDGVQPCLWLTTVSRVMSFRMCMDGTW